MSVMYLYLVLSVYIFQNPNHLPNWYMVKYRENDIIFFFFLKTWSKLEDKKEKSLTQGIPQKKIPKFQTSKIKSILKKKTPKLANFS